MTSALQHQRRRPGKVLCCCYVAGNSSNHSEKGKWVARVLLSTPRKKVMSMWEPYKPWKENLRSCEDLPETLVSSRLLTGQIRLISEIHFKAVAIRSVRGNIPCFVNLTWPFALETLNPIGRTGGVCGGSGGGWCWWVGWPSHVQ